MASAPENVVSRVSRGGVMNKAKPMWTETCPKCGDDISNYEGAHDLTCDECQMSCGWCVCADIIQDGHKKDKDSQ
jgi:hypothetical protein